MEIIEHPISQLEVRDEVENLTEALLHLMQLCIVPQVHHAELFCQQLCFLDQVNGALASELKKKTAYELL